MRLINQVPLTNRFWEAMTFAAQFHAGQMRKGNSTPYISHLLAVSSPVLEHGGTEDEVIAGLLHDVLSRIRRTTTRMRMT